MSPKNLEKRALLLNTSFYPNVGGVENSLLNIAIELINDGWEVFVVTSDRAQASQVPLKSCDKMSGALIYRYKNDHPLSYYFSCFRLIKHLTKQYKFNFVLSRSHVTTISGRLAGMQNILYLIPGIHKYQNAPMHTSQRSLVQYAKYWWNVYIQKWAIRLASKIIVFSELMKEQTISLVPEVRDLILCKPGADKERFRPVGNKEKALLRRELDIPVEATVMLCLGRLVKVKGIDLAIRTLRYCESNYVLLLVGDGPEKNALQEEAARATVQDQIRWAGATKVPETYYQVADMFLLPSIHETFGQVLLEATFSGLPVVAFDPLSVRSVQTATREVYQGFPELVILVRSYSEYSFAEGVRLAARGLSNEGQVEREAFIKSHTWASTVSEILKKVS